MKFGFGHPVVHCYMHMYTVHGEEWGERGHRRGAVLLGVGSTKSSIITRMLSVGARMLCVASASASFLTPLPAQTRQPGRVARAAVFLLPPAAPTAEEKARKSFVQTEMRSE